MTTKNVTLDNDLQRSLKGLAEEPYDYTPMTCAAIGRESLEEIMLLRRLLAAAYAGITMSPEGEMVDRSERPYIDFKRDKIHTIEEKIIIRANARARRGEDDDDD